MRKIEIKVSALMATALSGLITLLGFSGCKQDKKAVEGDLVPVPQSTIKVMYGVPRNVYKVVGEVTDAEGKAVEGATVEVSENGEPVAKVRTGYKGQYFTDYMRTPGELKVVVRPADKALDADSVQVSGEKLLKNPSTRINFKLKNRK